MAFANFFDRALMSVTQALNNADAATLQGRLQAQVVELAFDGQACRSLEGQAGLDLAVRLLARLYPTMRLTALDRAAEPARPGLEALAFAINPDIELARAEPSTVRLVFGATSTPGETQTVYAGSDGWLAKVSNRTPRGCGGTDLPLGAGGAACLGAANVFRLVFADVLPKGLPDQEAVLSLFDFTTGPHATQGPSEAVADFGLTPVVGIGAIGNGLVWALARTPRLTGTIHLVDPEKVELSNLQRYVLAIQTDVERVKVEVARQALAAGPSALTIAPFMTAWASYIDSRGHPTLQTVVAALDSARDRIEVQAALPRRVLNAWTQAGDLGVSRHGLIGDEACLACLYLPKGVTPNEDQLIAQALRLRLDLPVLHDIRERLANGQPVGDTFVREAAERLGADLDALMKLAGEPVRQFYAKAICGGQLLQLETGRPAVEVPLAFQSALAGIMLAADLVAEAGGLRRTPVPTKTIIDLTRRLGTRLSSRMSKPRPSAGARCICQDRDFVAVYTEAHGLARPSRAGRSRKSAERAEGRGMMLW